METNHFQTATGCKLAMVFAAIQLIHYQTVRSKCPSTIIRSRKRHREELLVLEWLPRHSARRGDHAPPGFGLASVVLALLWPGAGARPLDAEILHTLQTAHQCAGRR
jgi:hypothetical protein